MADHSHLFVPFGCFAQKLARALAVARSVTSQQRLSPVPSDVGLGNAVGEPLGEVQRGLKVNLGLGPLSASRRCNSQDAIPECYVLRVLEKGGVEAGRFLIPAEQEEGFGDGMQSDSIRSRAGACRPARFSVHRRVRRASLRRRRGLPSWP